MHCLVHIVVPPMGMQALVQILQSFLYLLHWGSFALSNGWVRATTSVFVRYWQSLSGDSNIRLMSASTSTIVSGFGDCIWDGYPGGTVSGWSFLQSLLHILSL